MSIDGSMQPPLSAVPNGRLSTVNAVMNESIETVNRPHRGGVLDFLLFLIVEMTKGASCGSVSLVHRGRMNTLATTGPNGGMVDTLHTRAGEGPAISATGSATSGTYLLADSSDVSVWPRFARLAREAEDIGSVLATVIRIDSKTRGVVTLVGRRHNALSGRDTPIEFIGAIAAAVRADLEMNRRDNHAAQLEQDLASAENKIVNLRRALESRDLIGQAKGILMCREGCGQEEAFRMLRVASQHLNRKVTEIVAAVIDENQASPAWRIGESVRALDRPVVPRGRTQGLIGLE